MRSAIGVLFCLAILQGSVLAKSTPRIMDKHLRTFDALVQGEFDNYNQFNFENNDFLDETDRVEEKHPRMYMRIEKVSAPQIGKHVYYQQMHNGDMFSAIYRQVLLVVKPHHQTQTLFSKSYKFKQPTKHQNLWEKAGPISVSMSDLKTVGENCDTHFNWVNGVFIGEMRFQNCVVQSKHGGAIHIASKTAISEDGYWHIEGGYNAEGVMRFGREDNIPIKMRRATRYTCWAALKTDENKENGEKRWDFFPNLSIHNQGDVAHFSRSDVPDKQYFIRLKETIFPAGKRPDVFEMFVHEATEAATTNYKEALSYTWTNSNANRLGLNLRWFQASCSKDK